MEDIAAGVTPAMDSTPAADPFVQQLLAEKADLQRRLEESEKRCTTLKRRLALYRQVYLKLTQIVQEDRNSRGAAA